MYNLPAQFEEFADARKQGFLTVKKWKEDGKNVVGTYCTFTPVELIMAADAIQVGLCGTSEEPIAEAEKVLPRNLCPLIKSSYGFAITDKCPYFYFADLVVGETTCDGKKKMYEYMSEIKDMHIMDLPQKKTGDAAKALWKSEMFALKDKLEEKFNIQITDEKLRKIIQLKNRERVAIKNFCELSSLTPPAITGVQMQKVLEGAMFKFDKEVFIAELNQMTADLKAQWELNNSHAVSPEAKRVLITGCPIGGAAAKVVTAIEESGGVVVGFENCMGLKANWELVDESKDPMEALAEKYLNIPCSVMMKNTGRFDILEDMISMTKADGVVDVILTACHTYNVETGKIKAFVNNEKNIPYMTLETDYSQSDIGQLKTRLGAFVEML